MEFSISTKFARLEVCDDSCTCLTRGGLSVEFFLAELRPLCCLLGCWSLIFCFQAWLMISAASLKSLALNFSRSYEDLQWLCFLGSKSGDVLRWLTGSLLASNLRWNFLMLCFSEHSETESFVIFRDNVFAFSVLLIGMELSLLWLILLLFLETAVLLALWGFSPPVLIIRGANSCALVLELRD